MGLIYEIMGQQIGVVKSSAKAEYKLCLEQHVSLFG